MAIQVPPLVLRQEKGSPLTAAEMDGNLEKLRDAINGCFNLLGVSLNANGTLKDGALNDPDQIVDGIITFIKLASGTIWAPGDFKYTSAATVYSTSSDEGWLDCVGGNVSRTTFANLFTAIGTTWGVGDGSTTFGIPNLTRRVLVGAGGTGSGTLANTVGSTGGAETHSLTSGENGPHAHSYGVPKDTLSSTGQLGFMYENSANGTDTYTNTTSSSGSGTAHNNMQPSAVVRILIKT